MKKLEKLNPEGRGCYQSDGKTPNFKHQIAVLNNHVVDLTKLVKQLEDRIDDLERKTK